MYLTGGQYKGRKISVPKDVKPTLSKVRESVFNMLQNIATGNKFLDMFAGSAIMGLEAISRGARSSTFVDMNSQAIKTIKSNISKMKIDEDTFVYQTSYMDFLKTNTKKFGVVFLDPPYKMKEVYDEVVNYMFEHDMLTDDAVIVKECDIFFNEDERFKKFKTYKYGIIHVSVYWR